MSSVLLGSRLARDVLVARSSSAPPPEVDGTILGVPRKALVGLGAPPRQGMSPLLRQFADLTDASAPLFGRVEKRAISVGGQKLFFPVKKKTSRCLQPVD